MIILAWAIIAAVVLGIAFGGIYVFSDGFSDWAGFFVVLGTVAGIAVAFVAFVWACAYIDWHGKQKQHPQQAEEAK